MFLIFFLYSEKITSLKKLPAILLLLVYLFNVAGYQILFSVVIQHSDRLLLQRLDENQYSDEELVQVKIPLHLPYFNSQSGYERYNGEVSFEGVYYRYVKRRVANDTLYILCLKNEKKTKLHSEQSEYAKKSNDLPTEKHSPSGKKANSLSEHKAQQVTYCFAAVANNSPQRTLNFTSSLASSPPHSNFQPPEAFA